MEQTIKENRERIKILQVEKQDLVMELRAKRARKKEIDAEMARIRYEIRRIKIEKGGLTSSQAGQSSDQEVT